MHDADEIKCLIFEVAIRNIVLGKVTKSGVSEANNKLIVNIFLTVWSYRPQPFMNRVKCCINILTLAVIGVHLISSGKKLQCVCSCSIQICSKFCSHQYRG